ncbi:MAG: protein kinase [Acidobacteria bacterium]|nr:protein kinase [Acidobacteriota bacterium]
MQPGRPDFALGPTRIGPYRLARRLGQGGMGEVFLAWDERLGRRVALKRIRREEPTAQERERLRREAAAAARLSHPAVVQIYDLVEDDTGDALVFEYVEGRTLQELLDEGLPSLTLAVRLAREIAEGLAAAHTTGLVHRDLKTENVMVTLDGHAKILDFGIAKANARGGESETLTGHGVVLGTLHAMSPEQARGGEVDARSDLFSLGVLLYELLTGSSPFRGRDVLDTLQRLARHRPPPVRQIRPEVPRALSDLADRLLAKLPEERPGSAAAVVRELAALSDRLEEPPAPETGAEGLTFAFPFPPVARSSGPSSSGPGSSGPGSSRGIGASESYASPRLRRLPLALAVVSLLLLLSLALGLGVHRFAHRETPPPLRVAVLTPRTPSGAGEAFRLAASGALEAALSALGSLDGIAPLDPTQTGPAASPAEAARISAADEVLALALEPQGPEGAQVSLRRVQGSDGRVLWAGSFPVPMSGEDRDLRLLADAVAVHLRRAWPERSLRPGTTTLEVDDRDYAELLRIKARLDHGKVPLEPELDRLEKVVRSSPRFLESHLLTSHVAASLFTSTHEPRHLERALAAARAGRTLAPGDPRPLAALFDAALLGHRPDEARRTLAELTGITPGDPSLHVLAGKLAESQGDLQQAIAETAAAVKRAPAWTNLFRLATLEVKAGRIADARHHLEELLTRSPDNLWGLDKLGNLELLEGDPARAERIYLDLIRRQPQRPFYTNLGLARSLLGRPEAAVEAYRHALELAPGHVTVLLNLADAELARGHGEEARSLYTQALDRLAATERAASLSPAERMNRAQCLAHLGRSREAVELTQSTLRTSGDDPEVLYNASLVYALVGDRASALVNAKLALEKGVQPRWFTLPAFGPLRNDRELRAMLGD